MTPHFFSPRSKLNTSRKKTIGYRIIQLQNVDLDDNDCIEGHEVIIDLSFNDYLVKKIICGDQFKESD